MKRNIIISIIILLISGIVSCILGIDKSWDLFSYHYYNAFAILNNRIGYDFMPAGIQSYLNPILDIIDYLIINTFRNNKELVAFLLGLPYGCFVFVLYLVNKKIFYNISTNKFINYSFITFATIIGCTECFIVSEIGLSLHDINIGIFILLSLLFILNFIETEKLKYLKLAGFFAGIAAGLKLVAVYYIIAILITFFVFNIKTNFQKLLYNMFILILFTFFGFVLVNGYWMFFLWKKFHNPIFPMYNAIFKSDLYSYVNYHDINFNDITIFKILFYPLVWSNTQPYKVTEQIFYDFRHTISYICFLGSSILFILKSKIKGLDSFENKKFIFILIFIIISYLLWIKTFGILRYFVPTLSLCGTVIAIFLYHIKIIMNNKNILIIVFAVFLILSFFKYKYPNLGRSNKLIDVPDLKFKDDSVVFLYGKPFAFYAAQKYPNTRFIYLYDDTDGQDATFLPSKKYYDDIDKIIANKKKYIIMSQEELIKNDAFHKYIKNKYLSTELKCIYTKKFLHYVDFYVCEYID